MFKEETLFELMLILFVVILVVIYVKSLDAPKKSKNTRKRYNSYKPNLTQRQLEYREYLKSNHWKEVREAALERADYKCQLCSNKEYLNVHHNNYKNLGHEDPNDLVVLCRNCHRKFHNVK